MVMIIIAVILLCISLVVFALALLVDALGWTQLADTFLSLSLAASSMSLILTIFGVFIFIIFDLPNLI
jgi:hypothetical protein